MLTQAKLREILDYNTETGELSWKYNPNKPIKWNTRWAGKIAGSRKKFYIMITIDGIRYNAHRVIWLFLYGSAPRYIDHKDGNGFNNRQDNLRETSMSQNIANANFGKGRGIEAHGAKYRARIWFQGVRHNIGSFETYGEAQVAYQEAADKFFGEYAFHNRNAD